MNKKVEDILNQQVEKEAYSSNLYLAMATWAEVNGLSGVADWLYVQADEERMHMLKFIKYINERGGQALVPALKKPGKDYKSVKSMFQEVLKHEQFISSSINEIVAFCVKEKDFTTHNWVQWFVNEQIEEEANARKILDKIKLVGDNNMYLFDRDIMALRAAAAANEAGAVA
jgi:ferritin